MKQRFPTLTITGRESIRFYKNLSNGYVVVVEKEYKNNPNDMETINIWAELSPSAATNARKNAPDTHVRNAILSTEDAAKIRKDAETAIENDEKITDKVRFFKTPDGNAYGFTVNGKIYIDPRIAGADTPIHEYAHLWCDMIRKTAPNGSRDGSLIHIHINHDLFRGRDFLCDGEKPLLLSPNLQFFLLIFAHPSIYRHCVRF